MRQIERELGEGVTENDKSGELQVIGNKLNIIKEGMERNERHWSE